MIIKILGPGCRNSIALALNTEKALKKLGKEAEIVKVEDLNDIMAYKVLITPAIVVNERVMAYGKVLEPSEIVRIIEQAEAEED